MNRSGKDVVRGGLNGVAFDPVVGCSSYSLFWWRVGNQSDELQESVPFWRDGDARAVGPQHSVLHEDVKNDSPLISIRYSRLPNLIVRLSGLRAALCEPMEGLAIKTSYPKQCVIARPDPVFGRSP